MHYDKLKISSDSEEKKNKNLSVFDLLGNEVQL